MAPIRKPIPVKLICGVTYAPDISMEKVVQRLEQTFSPVEIKSAVFDFSSFTSYYQDEMGSDLSKLFICFQGLYDPVVLGKSKVKTNEIEDKWSGKGRRRVNLDPGYITAAKLVLATTKDFAHRIYVGQGIYGDVQYRFRNGRFEPSKWTYPDYETDLAVTFFQNVRQRFIQQERENDPIIRL
ncbi:DUF4416 family protein [bacterium]|nr:DUF4416 family protein [bacterium]RQV97949.1 MAG: DUF4416 family protein [bacterium]